MTAWGPGEERASTPPTPIPGSVIHVGAAQAPDTTFSTLAEKRRPRGDQAFLEAEELSRRLFMGNSRQIEAALGGSQVPATPGWPPGISSHAGAPPALT